MGLYSRRCEAARTFTGGNNGDGFNGHSKVGEGTHPEAKHTTLRVRVKRYWLKLLQGKLTFLFSRWQDQISLKCSLA